MITYKEKKAILDALTEDLNEGLSSDRIDYIERDSFKDTIDKALDKLKKENE